MLTTTNFSHGRALKTLKMVLYAHLLHLERHSWMILYVFSVASALQADLALR